MDANNLSVSISGDLDSASSGGTSSDHSAVQQDNLSSPMAYGSLFLPNAGECHQSHGYRYRYSYPNRIQLGLVLSVQIV